MIDTQQLKRLIWSELADVHTNIPGTIISYDAQSGRAVVKPSLSKLLANGIELPAPRIVDVPVCWPSGDAYSALIACPLKAGDSVLLKFSERAVDDWLSTGEKVPTDPRMFDLSDAYATPTTDWRPINASPDRLLIRYGATELLLAKDGSMEVNAPAGTVWNGPGTLNGDWELNGALAHNGELTHNGNAVRNGNLTQNGNISQGAGSATEMGGELNITGTIKHNGKDIGSDHKHTDVQPGSGTSGGVV